MSDLQKNKKNNLKREDIVKKLAAYFLSLQPGSSLDSVRALASGMQASIGMISENISALEEVGAVRIERHGQLGSYLVDLSANLLWKSAVGEPLVIAHTLPSNRRYEGLAGALKQAFRDAGIETYFTFIRGSCTRLKALRNNRCHIAIMSQFAAEGMLERSEEIALVLPPGSFVSSHQLFFRSNANGNMHPQTAAIDPDSYDQTQISNMELEGRSVKYKNITFMNIRHYLTENEVDLAVWTEEDMHNQLGQHIRMQPLSKRTETILSQRNTKAALVVRAGDKPTCQLIKKVLIAQKIISYQQSVLAGKLIPEY